MNRIIPSSSQSLWLAAILNRLLGNKFCCAQAQAAGRQLLLCQVVRGLAHSNKNDCL